MESTTFRQLQNMISVNDCLKIIQEWLFPPTCLLCGDAGTAGRDLCAPCADELPYLRTCCSRCALPLELDGPTLCGRCLAQPPSFDTAFALLAYREPVRHLVHALKFHRQYPHARLLGALLADALTGRIDVPELLIPVPLHTSRFRQRGFNHSAEIAREVSRRLAIPLDTRVVGRSRATPPQVGLSAVERARNVKKAFALRGSFPARHVAIIDDVMSTGSTVNELAGTLRKGGAERIEVWVCARASR